MECRQYSGVIWEFGHTRILSVAICTTCVGSAILLLDYNAADHLGFGQNYPNLEFQ